MANSFGKTKKTKYTKKTGAGVYDVYHFETDDNQVLLDEAVGNIAKGKTLHDALTTIKKTADTGGQGAKDLATHVARTDNPHQVTKEQVKLGDVVNAKMDDAPTANSNNYVKSGGVYNAVAGANTAAANAQSKADAAYDLANGRSRAFVFNDAKELTSGTLADGTTISGYKVGDNIYIIATGVADFWISAITNTGTVSTVATIQNAKAGASVYVTWNNKYIKLTAVENKEDLSNYSTTQQIADKYRTKADSLSADETREQISNAKTELTDHFHKDINIPYSYINKTISLDPKSLDGGIDTAYMGFGFSEESGMVLAETISWHDSGSIKLWALGLDIAHTTNDSAMSILMKQVSNPAWEKWEGTSVVTVSADDDNGETRYYTYRITAIASKTDLTESPLSKPHVTLLFNLLSEGYAPAIANTKTTLTGDVSAEFTNKGGNVTTTLSDTGVAAGTYSCVSVNAKGRVTAGAMSLVFASSIDDPSLNNLAEGGVAIIG